MKSTVIAAIESEDVNEAIGAELHAYVEQLGESVDRTRYFARRIQTIVTEKLASSTTEA